MESVKREIGYVSCEVLYLFLRDFHIRSLPYKKKGILKYIIVNLKYSGTSPYGHLYITDTSILRTPLYDGHLYVTDRYLGPGKIISPYNYSL